MLNDNLLRPKYLKDFFGQINVVEQLKVFIYSAKSRNSVIDHILFYGPPGLGKTSLANIVANELEQNIISISAPSLEKPNDIIQILSQIEPGGILFIDEIHRLDKKIEEILYSVLEDFKLFIPYRSDENNIKTLELDVSPFTLIGATTDPGVLSSPFRDRFPIKLHLIYYSEEELAKIIMNNASLFSLIIEKREALEIAKRSRKTPRVANNNLKRIYDYLVFHHTDELNMNILEKIFVFLHINELGLTELDLSFIKVLKERFSGGPVSLESISAVLNENLNVLRLVIEPFLVNIDLIERTKRGRILTLKGLNYYKKSIEISGQ
ncbi:MAG TPA: Holliday junction branch migration DNA helicase RuvB [Candidatus Onthovivens sp.]|nr:Holliday junction branch migration DNA helicase RuvB [Candidatus Onthovivens sp.]